MIANSSIYGHKTKGTSGRNEWMNRGKVDNQEKVAETLLVWLYLDCKKWKKEDAKKKRNWS